MKKIFNNKNDLRVHFCRAHSEIQQNVGNVCIENSVYLESNEETEDCAIRDSEIMNVDNLLDSDKLGRNLFVNLYLTLETKYMLSKSAIQFLITGICDIGKLNSEYIYNNLKIQGFEVPLETIKKDLFFLSNNQETGTLRSTFLLCESG